MYNLNDATENKPQGGLPFRFHLKSVPSAAQTNGTKTQRASITIPNTPATLSAKKIPLQSIRSLPTGRLLEEVGDRIRVTVFTRVTASTGADKTADIYVEAANSGAADQVLGVVSVGPDAADRLLKHEFDLVVIDPSTITAAVVAGPGANAATIDLSVDLVLKIKAAVGGTPAAESFVIVGAYAEVFPISDVSP